MTKSELIRRWGESNPRLNQHYVGIIVTVIRASSTRSPANAFRSIPVFDEIAAALWRPVGAARLRRVIGQRARRPHRPQSTHRRYYRLAG